MGTERKSEQTGFEDLIESLLTEVLAKVGHCSLEELEKDLRFLHSLIDQYKRGNELLENLANPATTSDQREQIRQTLQEQRLRVAANRAEAERLHVQSQKVLERSARLMAIIERRIYERTHRGNSYAPELCGFCVGIGGSPSIPCLACNGRRTVLVRQPPLKCPRCNGTGKPTEHDRIQFSIGVCLVCRGKGWALVMDV